MSRPTGTWWRARISPPSASVPWANEPTAVVIHDCFLHGRHAGGHRAAPGAAEDPRISTRPGPASRSSRRRSSSTSSSAIPIPDYPLAPPIGRSGRAETVRQPYSLDAIDEFEPLIEDIYDYCEASTCTWTTWSTKRAPRSWRSISSTATPWRCPTRCSCSSASCARPPCATRSTPRSWRSPCRTSPAAPCTGT